jgi:hypothetical protein
MSKLIPLWDASASSPSFSVPSPSLSRVTRLDVFDFWTFRGGRSGDGGAELARLCAADGCAPGGADFDGATLGVELCVVIGYEF